MLKFSQHQNLSFACVETGQQPEGIHSVESLMPLHYPHCVGHKNEPMFLKFAAIITPGIITSVLESGQGNSDSFGKPGPP